MTKEKVRKEIRLSPDVAKMKGKTLLIELVQWGFVGLIAWSCYQVITSVISL